MFRRAITFCAAFFALFALAAVVHAADPTNPAFIPPWAGTDIPLILSLAKHSACKDAAEMIATDKCQSAIRNLQSAIAARPFPWRFEVTNGYQEGFFYHALQGYALEQSGDIPAAYRAYQNSRLYINEEAAWSTPDPELEVYLGIGRTCMKAGRWTDAVDYTETARINGAANSNIAVNADRLLIERARSLGDYKEAIELYKDLETLAPLTRDEYKNYAQILFWSHQDRPGFSELLEGITKLGIDNNLGVKDPMVDGFLNNIMRADDDEVKYFYDLLGWAIVDARALKGDEAYLAFLCNARTLFCKVYNFLEPEDDLKQVKKQIDQVKKKLASAKAEGVVHVARMKKAKSPLSTSVTSVVSKEGTVVTTPEVEVEDMLMLGDYYLVGKRCNEALAASSNALAVVTNVALACLPYDGTSMENAAHIGLTTACMAQRRVADALKCAEQMQVDGSMRASLLCLRLYDMVPEYRQRGPEDWVFVVEGLPPAHPAVLEYLFCRTDIALRGFRFGDAAYCFSQLQQRKAGGEPPIYRRWTALRIATGETEEVFSALLRGLSLTSDPDERRALLDLLDKTWSWASNQDLVRYWRQLLASRIYHALVFGPWSIGEARDWMDEWGKLELRTRSLLKKGKYDEALSILDSRFRQAGHDFRRGLIYAAIGKTNLAFEAIMKAYEKRCGLASDQEPQYPNAEMDCLDDLIVTASTNLYAHYRCFLAERWNRYVSVGRLEEATQVQSRLKELHRQAASVLASTENRVAHKPHVE